MTPAMVRGVYLQHEWAVSRGWLLLDQATKVNVNAKTQPLCVTPSQQFCRPTPLDLTIFIPSKRSRLPARCWDDRKLGVGYAGLLVMFVRRCQATLLHSFQAATMVQRKCIAGIASVTGAFTVCTAAVGSVRLHAVQGASPKSPASSRCLVWWC